MDIEPFDGLNLRFGLTLGLRLTPGLGQDE